MYSGHGIDNNELFLEGVTGLNKALDKYDWKMGNKFSTYATYWIWQAITRTINENSRLIRVPTHLTTYLQAVNKKENELGNILGRQPSIRELSIALGGAAAGYSEEKISDARKKAANPISIDRVIRSDDESNFSDFLKDKSANPKTETENNFKSAAIQKFLIHSLTPEEKDIISRWYGLEPYDAPQKTDLIAKELGKSKDKIRQLFQKAMRKLKKPNSISKIKPYIEDNDSIED
jgi:RNA polymerase primary sigma factor